MDKIKKYVDRFLKSKKVNRNYALTTGDMIAFMDEMLLADGNELFRAISTFFDFGYAKGYRGSQGRNEERRCGMNDLKIFENEEFGQIRELEIDGKPWFVGKDVAVALGYEKPRNAIAAHVDEEDKKGAPIQGALGGTQEMTIINESGLYALIFGSKLESAKKFKRWVTSEVLPTIRRTGTYNAAPVNEQIPVGEVASYLKVMDRVAVRQSTAPYKIAQAFKMVSEQFGIRLPADFVKVPEYEQMSLDVGKSGGAA